ncbi:MAG: UDP-N-acetylglucosamine 2-epimerase (non-hydrolyzing) [Candidatus Celaenobacter antarcticus]|nr:UDP-N-acetylglucosamine 2-epimerase (non-hydrolyzing) [Candidatus Celaenobacter antarcticus]MDP8313958.1 UDP-N-acetylglucosamine 2-epimerase (non-hydrolyzing) [Candidatus Celaenobacter antarcticus]
MKIVSIIGARPQFIKASPVSMEIRKNGLDEIIVHTGQHFDANMSNIFFDQMKIPEPDYNLGINSLSHGAMTGRMLEEIEKVLIVEKPDWVIVYGDTNSTLAGSLAAKKMHLKVAHIEAGLRSFNMNMPEEINRILTDRVSDILFCPTQTSVDNLLLERYDKFGSKIVNCGDVMLDAALMYKDMDKKPADDIPNKFILTTIHREENTVDKKRLRAIYDALSVISEETPIIIPTHPRTRIMLSELNSSSQNDRIKLISPVGYLEMLYLIQKCSLIITDSGGLQKESYFFEKPCVTIRDETEWTELVRIGSNIVAGTDVDNILNAYGQMKDRKINFSYKLFGLGNAAQIIVNEILVEKRIL